MNEEERQAKLEKLHNLLIIYEMDEEGLDYAQWAEAQRLNRLKAEVRRKIAQLETNVPRYT